MLEFTSMYSFDQIKMFYLTLFNVYEEKTNNNGLEGL